ncbi:hypothetical protein KRM28CT15_46080 [Krasilnikovia sp. M28-CT-15]
MAGFLCGGRVWVGADVDVPAPTRMLSHLRQVQRSFFGTPARACSMCWPQPEYVAFPQVRQVARTHMIITSLRWEGREPGRWPDRPVGVRTGR